MWRKSEDVLLSGTVGSTGPEWLLSLNSLHKSAKDPPVKERVSGGWRNQELMSREGYDESEKLPL